MEEYQEKEGIAEGLTKEQKKKYKRQYISIMFSATILVTIYLLAINELMGIFFINKQLWALAVIVLIIRFCVNDILESKEEIELIKERIEKRKKKNKKKEENEYEEKK